MKKIKKYILILIIFTITASFSYAKDYKNTDLVYHVVLLWLKSYNDEEKISKIIHESKQLRDIPGVLEVSSGKVLKSERVVVDDTFDISIIIKFAAKEYLKDYLVHPIHVKFADEMIKPLVNKITIYDSIILH